MITILVPLALIALVGVTGVVTIGLFPPYVSSPAATAIVDSTERARNAIEGMGETVRGFDDDLKRASEDDLRACIAPKDPKIAPRTPEVCLAEALKAARTKAGKFETDLYKTRNELNARLPTLRQAGDASDGWLWSFFDGCKRFLKWLGPTGLGAAIILLLAGFVVVRRWRDVEGQISLSLPLGIKVDANNIHAYRDAIKDGYYRLDERISKTYREKFAEKNLDKLFGDVKDEIDKTFGSLLIDLNSFEHRSTLYVPGFLGEELVRATAYFGKSMSSSSSVVGSRFSVRYGMIGMSWRLRHALYNPKVASARNNLIRAWGFTRKEAVARGNGTLAMAAFVIPSDVQGADPLGVIYLEGTKDNAFGDPKTGGADVNGFTPDDVAMEAIWALIAPHPSVVKLVASLKALREELRWDDKVIPETGR